MNDRSDCRPIHDSYEIRSFNGSWGLRVSCKDNDYWILKLAIQDPVDEHKTLEFEYRFYPEEKRPILWKFPA